MQNLQHSWVPQEEYSQNTFRFHYTSPLGTVFSKAIASASRVSELCAFFIKQPYYIFLPERVILRQVPTFLPQVSNLFKLGIYSSGLCVWRSRWKMEQVGLGPFLISLSGMNQRFLDSGQPVRFKEGFGSFFKNNFFSDCQDHPVCLQVLGSSSFRSQSTFNMMYGNLICLLCIGLSRGSLHSAYLEHS